MSDDKRKKKIDAWFVSLTEKYEVTYFVNDIKKSRPKATTEDIHKALDTCVDQIKPSEGRKKLETCVLSKLPN